LRFKTKDDIVFPCGLTLPQLRAMSVEDVNQILFYDRVAFGAFFFCNPTPDGRKGLIDLKYYLDGIPKYHVEISDMLNNISEVKKGYIIAPRNSSKTALVTRLGAMHEVVYRKSHNILIGTEDPDMGIEYLQWIKDELELNPLLVRHFGTFKPTKKYDGTSRTWRNDCIETVFRQKIFSRSMGKRVRGSNFLVDRIQCAFVDDPESDRNTKNNRAMERNRNWLNKEVIFSLTDDGWCIVAGNFVTPGCITNKLDRSKFWEGIKIAAMDKDLKTSFWESRRPAAGLLREKERLESMGDYTTFWLEYMNDVKRASAKRFDPDEYRFWTGEVYSKESQYLIVDKLGQYHSGSDEISWQNKHGVMVPVRFFLGVDLAFTEEEQNDFNAFSVNAMDSDNNIYDIEKQTLKTTRPTDILDWITSKHIVYQFECVSIESIGAQRVVAQNLKDECERLIKKNKEFYMLENLPSRIHKIEYHKDSKTQRVLGALQPKMKNGKIHFRCSRINNDETSELLPVHRNLLDQYDSFPNLEHDDLIDADEMCISKMNSNNVAYSPFGIDAPILTKIVPKREIKELWKCL